MKTRYILHALFLLTATAVFAQVAKEPPLVWQKTFGGTSVDRIAGHRLTPEGGYLILGTTSSSDGDVVLNKGGKDIWLIKLDAKRNIINQLSIGGTGTDSATFIQTTSDGGCIIAGVSNSTDGDLKDVTGTGNSIIVKLSSSNTIEWVRKFGAEKIITVEETSDKQFIAIGDFPPLTVPPVDVGTDIGVIKLTATGNTLWEKKFGGSDDDRATDIHTTKDGGYIFSGYTLSRSGSIDTLQKSATSFYDGWVVKLDEAGSIQWQKIIGGGGYDDVQSAKQTFEGGYISIGTKDSSSVGSFFHLVKMDSVGNISFEKLYGGVGGNVGFGINQQPDSGYMFVGLSNSTDISIKGNHGNEDILLFRVDTVGKKYWHKWLGGSAVDIPSHIIEREKIGGYIISGMTNSNDSNVTNNHGSVDLWLARIGGPGGTGVVGFEHEGITINLYPNPTQDFVHIDLPMSLTAHEMRIYNSLGETVLKSRFTTEVDVKQLGCGVYYLTLFDGDTIIAQEKFVKK